MIKFSKAEELLRRVWEKMGGGFVEDSVETEDLNFEVNKFLNRKLTPRIRKKNADIAEALILELNN